jgi:hypothetical protein
LLIDIEASFESKVQQFINAVTAYIERYTGRKFSVDSSASTRTYDGDGTNEIYIDDAFEITKVEVSYGFGSDFTEITDYYTYPSNTKPITKIILPYNYFWQGNQNVKVTAKWGYGASVPEDLSFAATVMVAGIINSSNQHEGEVQSETIGRYSVTYKTGSNQAHDFSNAKDILKMYKRYA